MRIRIGSPFLLTIISIFSILFFATSVAAQQASDMSTMGNSSGMPPMGNSSGMPPVGGQSPAQNALALAQAAKLAADQQVNTAQGTLESAQSAVQTAQQTLTTAQETLASATSALQEAENAVEAETQQKAELIRVAEQAVQEAEQNLQTAQQELDSARSALQELEQQIATAQGAVTTAEGKTNEAVKGVNDAKAKVAQLMGNSSGMPPMNGGNDQAPPTITDPGNPGTQPPPEAITAALKPEEWDCYMRGNQAPGPGTRVDIIEPSRYDPEQKRANEYNKRLGQVCIRLERVPQEQKAAECTAASRCVVAYASPSESIADKGDFEIIVDGTPANIHGSNSLGAASVRAGGNILKSIRSHLDNDKTIVASNIKAPYGYVYLQRIGGINQVVIVDGSIQLFSNINKLSDGEANAFLRNQGRRWRNPLELR